MPQVRIKERGGKVRLIGMVEGDTFVSVPRTYQKHLFRGGAESVEDALALKTGAWGVDVEVMHDLYENHGVKLVEIPVDGGRYRVRLEDLFRFAFQKEFGGHRPQYFLNLKLWAFVPS